MRVGIYLPQIGPEASQARLVETAQAAEAAGFDSLWVLDHVVLREEYGTPYPYAASGRLPIPTTANLLEPLILLTYAAAMTQRIALGTAVLVLPMRAPVLHAKMLASLDHLAGGRFILGAGVGWWQEEFAALSMPFAQRGKRMDEYLQVLKQLWSMEYAEFQGEFYNAAGWACHPHPPRPIPIWLGGNSKQQLRRVGQFADGWLANPAMLPTLEADFDRAREAAVRAGRSAEALQLAINRVAVLSRQDMPAAADTLMQLKERGVDHAILVLAPGESAVASLLQEFAATYLADVQA
jgi:probable F420-dependent oxidoreductase